MKKIITAAFTILFLLTGACQAETNVPETATGTPVRIEATVPAPSATPSPVPTITSTPVPLTFPLEAGTALPEDFSSLKISAENAASLEEIIRIKQQELVFFDTKYWDGNWLVDTNQGVKLLNEAGEWTAELAATQRTCPRSENMGSRAPSNIFIGPGGIGVVALDGVHIYSPDGQEEIAFVPLDEKYLALGWSCTDALFFAVVSPDMKWVAVSKRGISYNTTEIFSTESGENVISLPGDAVRMFSPDSQYLLFESGVNRFFLYKTSDWSQSLLLRSEDYIFTFGFSPSSEYLFYHRSSGWVIFRPSDPNSTLVNKQAVSLMFNRNTNEIGMLYWGDEENIHVWDFDSGQEIRMEKIDTDGWEYPAMDLPSITGFEREGVTNRGTFNTTCDLHEDEFTCYLGPEVCNFDLNGGQSCASVQSQPGIKKSIDGVWGEHILYEEEGSYSGLLPPWEISTDIYWTGSTWWMTLAEDNPPGFQWSMMSPDRSHFMYTTGEAGNQLNIILVFMTNDIEVGRIKLQRLLNAVISPDSKYMLAAVNTIGDQVWLLDLETGKVIKEFTDRTSSARGLAFSADSRLAAYVDVIPVEENGFFVTMGKLLVYDLVEGKELTSIDLDLKKGNVNSLTFSLDSSLIAAGTFDGKVSIYDVGTGEQVHSWYAHTGAISDLDFSPDGNWLLTAGGMDENIKLWTVAP